VSVALNLQVAMGTLTKAGRDEIMRNCFPDKATSHERRGGSGEIPDADKRGRDDGAGRSDMRSLTPIHSDPTWFCYIRKGR
jgi:hypothetical protein